MSGTANPLKALLSVSIRSSFRRQSVPGETGREAQNHRRARPRARRLRRSGNPLPGRGGAAAPRHRHPGHRRRPGDLRLGARLVAARAGRGDQPGDHACHLGAHGGEPRLGHVRAGRRAGSGPAHPRRRPGRGLQRRRHRRPGAGRLHRLPALPAPGRRPRVARGGRRVPVRLLELRARPVARPLAHDPRLPRAGGGPGRGAGRGGRAHAAPSRPLAGAAPGPPARLLDRARVLADAGPGRRPGPRLVADAVPPRRHPGAVAAAAGGLRGGGRARRPAHLVSADGVRIGLCQLAFGASRPTP